jgi:hypothetical protein
VSFSAQPSSNSRLPSRRRQALAPERKAATRKHFRRAFFEQLESRQVMATIVDTPPGGGLPPGGGTDVPVIEPNTTWDGSKVSISDPRVQLWPQYEFVTDSFLVGFQNTVTREQAEQTLATEAPGSSIKTWDDEMHFAWVNLPAGMTRDNVIDVGHHFLGLSNTLYAEPNFTRQRMRMPNDPAFDVQWSLNNTGQFYWDSQFPLPYNPPTTFPPFGIPDADIDAPEAWDLTVGSPNTIVAVIDSGMNLFEPDLLPNLWVNPGEIAGNGLDDDGNGVIDDIYGYDAGEDDGDPQDAAQTEHGMNVSSVIASPGDDGQGMTGVSWHSKIMTIRNEDASGGITTGGVIGGYNYVTKMKLVYQQNIVAANMSFGGPAFSFAEFDALSKLNKADVLMSIASDNTGTNHDITPIYPAGYEISNIIAVTATDGFDELGNTLLIPQFGYGRKNVDIAAPGIEIMMNTFRYPFVVPPNTFPFIFNLEVATGTSFATPHVSGVAALIKSLAPYLNAQEVKQLLLAGVDKTPQLAQLVGSGGRLNAFNSLNLIPKTTISGTVFQDANNDKVQGIGETGLANWTVYLDLDNDASFDTGEPSAVAAADGTYTFDAWVDKGTYRVRQILQAPYTQTTPVSNGPHVINVTTRGQDFANLNFGNRQQPGTIRGTKFLDLDADGSRDFGEPGLAGVMFYVDLNNNRSINVGEPAAFTDANGNFSIPNVQPGTYFVREILAGGYLPTLPSTLGPNGLPDPVLSVTVTSNTTTAPLVFGNQTAIDYGDLPESLPGIPDAYNTTIAEGGPSHGILPGFSLGTRVDFEVNGQPSVAATGDDNNPTGSDDEDGLIDVKLVQGAAFGAISFFVTNTNSLKGYVQAWVDFNGNGSFADPGDQILKNYAAINGTNTDVAFPIPAGATPGSTYIRLRYSVDRNLGPDGANRVGEVEDYQRTIFSGQPIARPDRFPEQLFANPDPAYPSDPLIKQESVNNPLNVLRNDPLPVSNQLRIYAPDFPLNIDGNTVTLGQDIDGKDILLFTPRATNPFTGDFTFTYRVYDPVDNPGAADLTKLSDPASVTVKVTAKDPRPVDNTYTMVRDTTLSMDGVLNPSVLENDVFTAPIRIGSVTPAISPLPNTVLAGATVTIVAGNLVFTPPTGFTGTAQFTYTVTDDDISTVDATAIVTVQVTDPPPPPTGTVDLSKYLATISLRVVDARGFVQGVDPGFHVDKGEVVYVEVYSEDIRPGGSDLDRGVEAAFLDLLYDKDLVSVNITDVDGNGSVEPDVDFIYDRSVAPPANDGVPNYNLDKNAVVNSPQGVVNELGSARDRRDTSDERPDGGPLGKGLNFVVRVGFDANEAGTFFFVADPAEDSTNRSQILLAPPLIQTVPVPLPDPNPVTARDDQVFLMPLLIPLTIVDPFAGPEFVNIDFALDVNADAQVNAIDALIVVNELNTHGTRNLHGFDLASGGELPPSFYVDVNGDGQVTAFDALRIINWLNGKSNGLSAPEDTSGGEFVQLTTASAGEATEEPVAEASATRSVTPVLASTTATSSSKAAPASRRVEAVSNGQDNAALLYLTAVDQLMSSHSDDADGNSTAASDIPLTDWLEIGSQLSSSRSKRFGLRNR